MQRLGAVVLMLFVACSNTTKTDSSSSATSSSASEGDITQVATTATTPASAAPSPKASSSARPVAVPRAPGSTALPPGAVTEVGAHGVFVGPDRKMLIEPRDGNLAQIGIGETEPLTEWLRTKFLDGEPSVYIEASAPARLLLDVAAAHRAAGFDSLGLVTRAEDGALHALRLSLAQPAGPRVEVGVAASRLRVASLGPTVTSEVLGDACEVAGPDFPAAEIGACASAEKKDIAAAVSTGAVPVVVRVEPESKVQSVVAVLAALAPAGLADPSIETILSGRGPRGGAAIGGASVSGGSVGNAGAVVAGMAAGFRRCYQRGLQEDPTMKGSVRITAKIGPSGEVLSASPSASSLSGTVTSCVAGVVSSRTFSPPEGGGATIVIPVSFMPQP